ncbi:MAG: helix-turn-helix domain-containing protein, partial [Nitrosopumilaceae archaeon]
MNLTFLSKQVIKYRMKNHWTQQELARRAQVHRQTIRQIENHHTNIKDITLLRLAHAFGITPLELLNKPTPLSLDITEVSLGQLIKQYR